MDWPLQEPSEARHIWPCWMAMKIVRSSMSVTGGRWPMTHFRWGGRVWRNVAKVVGGGLWKVTCSSRG